MSEPINKKDIITGDPFKEIASEIEIALKQLTEFDTSLKSVSTNLVTVSKSAQTTVQGITAITEAEKQSKKIVDEKIANDRLAQKLKKEQQSAEQALQRQREKGMAQMAREAKATAEAERPYNKLSRTLNELRKKYKDLAVDGRENTVEAKKMRDEIGRLDSTLKKADASTGQFQRNVGNYPNTFKSAIGALGQLGIAFSGVAIAKSAFNTIRDFDEANADMAKTLGISTVEASKLSMEFTKLGSVTNIQGLQEIATIGGQFGISASEIGGFVSSMDKLNVALGSDFGGVEETAKQLGALRNIFTDIKTENIDQDLLGIGNALNELSSKGARVEVVSDFANRISGLATPLGVTAGEILGLSATLAKLNVNTERGGTAVGTIFQRMTQDASGFAKVAGVSTEEFTKLLNEDMVGAFKLVAGAFKGMEGDNVLMSKTLESLKLTGSGASEVFLKMASNTQLLDENVKLSTESLKEQDSILQEVEKKSSTVGASVAKLGNAWDSFILGVNEGTGAQNGIITFFDFVARNLPTIISGIAKLTAGFVAFKTVQAIVNTDMKALVSNFTSLKSGAEEGGKSMSGFGNALKGIGWSVAIGLAIDLGMKLWDIASGAEDATRKMNLFNKSVREGQKFGQDLTAGINEQIKKEQTLLDLKLSSGQISRKEYENELQNLKEKQRARIRFEIQTENENKQRAKANIEQLQELYDRANKMNPLIRTKEMERIIQMYELQKAQISESNATLKELYTTSESLKKQEIEATIEKNNNTNATNNNTKAKKDNTKEIEAQKRALQDLAEIENEQAEKRKSLDNERSARQDELNQLIKESIETNKEFEMTEQEREIKAVKDKYKRMEDLTEEFGYGQVEMTEAMREEINAINTKYAQQESEKIDEDNKKKIEAQKELADELNKIQEGISQAMQEQIDRRIEFSKREEEQAKSRQDFFENLAENGNITAQQSISEQIEIQREAQEEQARLERKKQQIEMISAGLSTFNASIANGKTPASALAETVLSTSTLVGILKNLNFFAKGTDNAPAGLAVVDEKGAELITDKYGNIKEIGQNKGARFTMLDQGDKVLTATKTAQYFDKVKVANTKTDNAGNSMDLININETLKRIESLNRSSKTTVDWGGISGGVANIVERKIVGRSRTTNVFRS